MITHLELASESKDRQKMLLKMVRNNQITLAGNRRLKIYGHLNCKSGKRMKIENRVFFTSEAEAVALGYRPCGSCMRDKYQIFQSQIAHTR